jgi:hypothetical protein
MHGRVAHMLQVSEELAAYFFVEQLMSPMTQAYTYHFYNEDGR